MKKTFRVERSGLQAAMRQAKQASACRKEVCGLLINNGSHFRLLSVHNATNRLGKFEITPSWCRISLRANAVAADKIAGTYHSHPAGYAEPGPGDIAGTWNGAYMLIIADWGEQVRLWQIRDGKAFCWFDTTIDKPCHSDYALKRTATRRERKVYENA